MPMQLASVFALVRLYAVRLPCWRSARSAKAGVHRGVEAHVGVHGWALVANRGQLALEERDVGGVDAQGVQSVGAVLLDEPEGFRAQVHRPVFDQNMVADTVSPRNSSGAGWVFSPRATGWAGMSVKTLACSVCARSTSCLAAPDCRAGRAPAEHRRSAFGAYCTGCHQRQESRPQP